MPCVAIRHEALIRGGLHLRRGRIRWPQVPRDRHHLRLRRIQPSSRVRRRGASSHCTSYFCAKILIISSCPKIHIILFLCVSHMTSHYMPHAPPFMQHARTHSFMHMYAPKAYTHAERETHTYIRTYRHTRTHAYIHRHTHIHAYSAHTCIQCTYIRTWYPLASNYCRPLFLVTGLIYLAVGLVILLELFKQKRQMHKSLKIVTPRSPSR